MKAFNKIKVFKIGLIAVACSFIVLVVFTTLSVHGHGYIYPTIQVKVIDESGNPIENVTVMALNNYEYENVERFLGKNKSRYLRSSKNEKTDTTGCATVIAQVRATFYSFPERTTVPGDAFIVLRHEDFVFDDIKLDKTKVQDEFYAITAIGMAISTKDEIPTND